MAESGNGWNQYQQLVLYRLDAVEARLSSIETQLSSIHTSVTVLKLKVAAIGSGAGLLVSVAWKWLAG